MPGDKAREGYQRGIEEVQGPFMVASRLQAVGGKPDQALLGVQCDRHPELDERHSAAEHDQHRRKSTPERVAINRFRPEFQHEEHTGETEKHDRIHAQHAILGPSKSEMIPGKRS
jgi:hypothetical protein